MQPLVAVTVPTQISNQEITNAPTKWLTHLPIDWQDFVPTKNPVSCLEHVLENWYAEDLRAQISLQVHDSTRQEEHHKPSASLRRQTDRQTDSQADRQTECVCLEWWHVSLN